jgi:predicted HAD superfamily Cof-like phosphohydrolase
LENPIKQIYKFNQQAGLLENGYSDVLESSYQIEEALENFNLSSLCDTLYMPTESSPKEVSREILRLAISDIDNSFTGLADVDRLDKACDAVVFAVGSMAKLGLNPQQITKALNIVMKANFTKLAMPKDEHGKLTKPDDFVGPEVELQRLLDERTYS